MSEFRTQDVAFNSPRVEGEKVKRIKRNRLQCLDCKNIIESTHRHDFVSCRCGKIFVDGGKDYLRCGGDFSKMKDMVEYYDD